jgi:hypothetical protein
VLTPCGSSKAQKKWLASNFRLTIDGLDCSFVNKLDALVIKQEVAGKEPTNIEFPNLVFTVAESHAESIYQWHEDFVIKGNNGQENEKTGTLEYLTPNLSTALFTLDFHGLGIFKATPDKVEAGGEQVRRVKVEMYCEEMAFKFDASVANC